LLNEIFYKKNLAWLSFNGDDIVSITCISGYSYDANLIIQLDINFSSSNLFNFLKKDITNDIFPLPKFFRRFDFLKKYIYLNFIPVFKRLRFRLFSNAGNFSNALFFSLFNRAYFFGKGRKKYKVFRRYSTFFLDSSKINTTILSSKTPYSTLPGFFQSIVFKKIRGQTVPRFF